MATFVKGDVVVLPFPYSDLSQSKRRPAIIISVLAGYDLIICQMTTQAKTDADALPLNNADFATGSLDRDSNIRPNKLFTADSRIILYRVGSIKQSKLDEIVNRIAEVIRR